MILTGLKNVVNDNCEPWGSGSKAGIKNCAEHIEINWNNLQLKHIWATTIKYHVCCKQLRNSKKSFNAVIQTLITILLQKDTKNNINGMLEIWRMEIQCNYLAMYKKGTELMACSHCPTPRPIKRQIKKSLIRIVWRCSYYTETDINTDSHWVLCKVISVCLSLHICRGVRRCEHAISLLAYSDRTSTGLRQTNITPNSSHWPSEWDENHTRIPYNAPGKFTR